MSSASTVVPEHVDATANGTAEPDFARRVVRSFAWQGGAQLAAQFVSWAATLVVVRLLSPGDYGLMAMVTVFLNFLVMGTDVGLGAASVQAGHINDTQLRRVQGVILTSSSAGALIMFLAAPLISAFFHEPRLTLVARVLSITFLFNGAAALWQAQVIRALDFRTKAKVDVGSAVTGAACSLLLAQAGYGVWALVFGMVGQSVAKLIGYRLVRPQWIWPVFSFGTLQPLMRFGAIIYVDRLLYFFYTNLDAIIAGKALGKEELGLYTIALTVAAAPLQKIMPTLTHVSFAAFARIQNDHARVQRNVLRALRVGSAISFPTLFGLAAIAPMLLPVVLGERWSGAVVPFQLMCLVLPLRTIKALLGPALQGGGRPEVNLTNMVISLVLTSAGLLVGVQYGVIGLCLAWVIVFPVVFLITTHRTLRALQVPARAAAEALFVSAAAAAIMYVVVVSARAALPASWPAPASLAALVAIGVGVYCAAAFVFNRQLLLELRAALFN